jgi:hypothetical protein
LAELGGAREVTAFASGPEWARLLAAPCTEVFTAFGVEEGFGEGAERFMRAVGANPPEGYYGAAFGEGVGDGEGGEKASRMVLGWVSREAHFEAKGKPGGEYCVPVRLERWVGTDDGRAMQRSWTTSTK